MEGTTLVVTDVDVNELEYDSRFYFILRSRYRFLTSSSPFKLMVRSQEACVLIQKLSSSLFKTLTGSKRMRNVVITRVVCESHQIV